MKIPPLVHLSPEAVSQQFVPRAPDGGRTNKGPGTVEPGLPREALGDDLALPIEHVGNIIGVAGRIRRARCAHVLRGGDDQAADRRTTPHGIEHVGRALGVSPQFLDRTCLHRRNRRQVNHAIRPVLRENTLQVLTIQDRAIPPQAMMRCL